MKVAQICDGSHGTKVAGQSGLNRPIAVSSAILIKCIKRRNLNGPSLVITFRLGSRGPGLRKLDQIVDGETGIRAHIRKLVLHSVVKANDI